MNDIQHKAAIKETLSNFAEGALAENARHLLNTLGYQSERVREPLNQTPPRRLLIHTIYTGD